MKTSILTFSKKIFWLFLFLILLAPTAALADAQSGVCIGGVKDIGEVGVFMAGVCNECWDEGNCSINDFLTLMTNTGNYILSIVAGLVFLVYIMGGFWWIIAHGDKGLVEKGKKWIKTATVGLIIVLTAYTAVVALRSAITGEIVSEGYVICSNNEETESQMCGINARCYGFTCMDACSYRGGSCVNPGSEATLDTDMSCGAAGDDCPDLSQVCCQPIGNE